MAYPSLSVDNPSPEKSTPDRDDLFRRLELRNAVLWICYNIPASLSGPFLASALFPAVFVRLGASDFEIGLLNVVGTLMAPALWLGVIVNARSANKARDTALYGVYCYLPFLLPLAALLLPLGESLRTVFLAAAFVSTAAYNTLCSVQAIVLTDLFSRVTRASKRGRITGIAGFVGGGAALGGSFCLSLVLGQIGFPTNYACAFAVGVVFACAGSIIFVWTRELPGHRAAPSESPPSFRAAVGTLQGDRRFLWFLVPAISIMGFAAVSVFFIPTALRRGLPDAYVGYFAIAASVSSIVGPPIYGWLADHWGRGRTAFLASATAASAVIAFAHVPTGPALLVAYGAIMLGSSAVYSMIYLIVLDLAPAEHRGTYVAARYAVQGLCAAPLYPLAGYATAHLGAQWVFYAGAACCLFTGLMMLRVVGTRPAGH